MAKIENPKVFISYCGSNEEYINKVVDFAKRLRSNGIDVVLDQFQMKLGNDMNNFMEKCINDKTITNVLILLSPDYKTKADSRSGGAGIETQIISIICKFSSETFESNNHLNPKRIACDRTRQHSKGPLATDNYK